MVLVMGRGLEGWGWENGVEGWHAFIGVLLGCWFELGQMMSMSLFRVQMYLQLHLCCILSIFYLRKDIVAARWLYSADRSID